MAGDVTSGGWSKFLRWMSDHADSSWFFRGHGDANYLLMPTIGRVANGRSYREIDEKRLFSEFKRRSKMLILGKSPETDWEWLTLAQHFGVPTRLLDWTANPLVAAYFAIASGEAKGSAEIIAIRTSAAEFIDMEKDQPFSIEKVQFFEAPLIASRVSAQSGLFTVHPSPSTPWNPPTAELRRFRIAPAKRDDFRSKLHGIGINAAFVWGDLQGLGEHLNWHFRKGIPFASARTAQRFEIPTPGIPQTNQNETPQ